jgi:drug/metabolite transporter (DMT)-like permease
MWYVYAAGAAALWGLEYALLGRLFDGRISPLFLLALQMLTGAVIMGSMVVLTGQFHQQVEVATSDRNTMMLILFSTFAFTLGSFLIATSIKEGNAVLAGLAEISYPLFIIVFSVMLGWAEPLNARALIGGALIMVGAVFLKTAA